MRPPARPQVRVSVAASLSRRNRPVKRRLISGHRLVRRWWGRLEGDYHLLCLVMMNTNSEQRVGDPQELRVGDDAQAQEQHVVAEVLRISGNSVGAGRNEAGPELRRGQ